MKTNSLYNIILDGIVAIAFVSTMIINACGIQKVTTTLNKIEECRQNANVYPTLKNREVMNERVDSLWNTIPSIYK